MEINLTKKTVEVEVYVTSDGEQFDDYDVARTHEVIIEAEKRFDVNAEKMQDTEDQFYIMESYDDVHLFEEYADALDIMCACAKDIDLYRYPCLCKYDMCGCLNPVTDEEYLKAKELCSMYEFARDKK